MRQKTSITLSAETVRAIDEVAAGSNRSRVIEQAVDEFLARKRKEAREARDLEILNDVADALNAEMTDVLEGQAEL